jgi:hypothetical protein
LEFQNMSTVTRIILEAERESVKEFMREEGLRAAIRAASQASLARKAAALRQEPSTRQEPGRREPAHQEPTPGFIVSNDPTPGPLLFKHKHVVIDRIDDTL